MSTKPGEFHYITSWDYSTDTAVSGLNTEVLQADWSGNQEYSTSWSSSSSNGDVEFSMSWITGDLGMTLPLNGDCPEGSIDFIFAPYEMEMVFDGSSTASWTLNLNDQMISNGTEQLECGEEFLQKKIK